MDTVDSDPTIENYSDEVADDEVAEILNENNVSLEIHSSVLPEEPLTESSPNTSPSEKFPFQKAQEECSSQYTPMNGKEKTAEKFQVVVPSAGQPDSWGYGPIPPQTAPPPLIQSYQIPPGNYQFNHDLNSNLYHQGMSRPYGFDQNAAQHVVQGQQPLQARLNPEEEFPPNPSELWPWCAFFCCTIFGLIACGQYNDIKKARGTC